MPGNSWRDRLPRSTAQTSSSAPDTPASTPDTQTQSPGSQAQSPGSSANEGSATNGSATVHTSHSSASTHSSVGSPAVAASSPSTASIPPANLVSPHLNQLLEQRQQLESRMHSLVAGTQNLDAREAARFHVPTFAQRRAEHREWEMQRDTDANRSPGSLTSARSHAQSPSALQPALRTGLRHFQQPVNRWLDERDQQRQRLRDQARDRLAPLEKVAAPVRDLDRQVRDYNRQFSDLDKRLADEGMEEERAELRKMGMDKLQTAERYSSKATAVLDAPKKAADKIDAFWKKRDNDIRGAMDRFGSYVERSQKRLHADSGGSGDLFERMMQNRLRALEQRREQQRQEQRDQERRDRALKRKKTKEDT